MISRVILLTVGIVLLCHSATSQAIDLSKHPKVDAVVTRLVENKIYTRDELVEIFNEAKFRQSVLDAMTSPAEYKFTWGKYRKLFLKQDRIDKGVEFWKEHREVLERASSKYGVPESMIVAIIGVESKFGQFKGKYKVLDSLVTLVSGFPRRSAFFADELEHFLILTKQNDLDPQSILGSYAGAVGYPQFISSSYRNFAVDFNADGSTDLIGQVDDAIGSIANYFIENGWKPGEPVTSQAIDSVPNKVREKASRKRKVKHKASLLRELGAQLNETIDGEEMLGVLELNASEYIRESDDKKSYIVRAGDTACQIAERHKVSCRELMKLNHLNSKGDIFRDQKLKLPTKATKQSEIKENDKTLVKSSGSKWEVARSEIKGNEEQSAVRHVDKYERPVFFYTHANFYAITRYNQSVLYAMAVHDLSEAIKAGYQEAKEVQK